MQVVIHKGPKNAVIGLSRDETLAHAGRLVMRHQTEQVAPVDWCVQPREGPDATQLDAGQVHRLRVATRRLRTILRVFKPYYKAKAVQPVARGLRDLAAALSRAREQDVNVRALQHYHQSVDEETRTLLQPILEDWQRTQAAERQSCSDYLASERHAAWLRDLSAFTQSDAADRPLQLGQSYYLRHALDGIITGAMEDIRAYDTLPLQPYVSDIHSLRIAIKRLRYLCEALQEVLPTERAAAIISASTTAQADYGKIVDARLSAQRALRFVAEHRGQYDNAQALRGILSFAREQQHIVDEGLAGWKHSIEPLLVL